MRRVALNVAGSITETLLVFWSAVYTRSAGRGSAKTALAANASAAAVTRLFMAPPTRTTTIRLTGRSAPAFRIPVQPRAHQPDFVLLFGHDALREVAQLRVLRR